MTPATGATNQKTIDICFVDEDVAPTKRSNCVDSLYKALVKQGDGRKYCVNMVHDPEDLNDPLSYDLLLIEPYPFVPKYVTQGHLEHPLYKIIMQRHEAKKPVILVTTQPISLVTRCGLRLGEHYAGFVQKWCYPGEELVPMIVEVLGLDKKQER